METKIFALKADATNEGLVSSIVNEVKRTILTLFLTRRFHMHKKA